MAPVHIGVLIVPPIQLLDVAPIDLFAMLTTEYFEACHLPQSLLDISIPTSDLTITYISADAATLAPTTASLGLGINAGLDDAAVAPGKLDILLIPGPPPGMHIEEPVLEFVRAHVAKGVDLLTICTGVFVAAAAGVLDGKHATGSRGVIEMLVKSYPKVEWEDKRWWNDGRVWTSGGITNGMDMVATYMRHRWPGAATETVLEMADVQVRSQDYAKSKLENNAWWVWHIFKAWIGGLTSTQRNKKTV